MTKLTSANTPDRIQAMNEDVEIRDLRRRMLEKIVQYRYAYNFSWLGRPVIQLPEDIVAMQELIWTVKPDLIIETGVAHGGSLVFYASLLELLGAGQVLGIDIDIRQHNRREIEGHALAKRLTLLQGSSVSTETLAEVRRIAA